MEKVTKARKSASTTSLNKGEQSSLGFTQSTGSKSSTTRSKYDLRPRNGKDETHRKSLRPIRYGNRRSRIRLLDLESSQGTEMKTTAIDGSGMGQREIQDDWTSEYETPSDETSTWGEKTFRDETQFTIDSTQSSRRRLPTSQITGAHHSTYSFNIDEQDTSIATSDCVPETQGRDIRQKAADPEPAADNRVSMGSSVADTQDIKWDKMLEEGYTRTIIEVFEQEKKVKHFLVKEGVDEWTRICLPILASMHRPILHQLAGGNIARALQSGQYPDLAQVYEENSPWSLRSTQDAPCIYVRMLVNDKGEGPTPNEMLQLIRRIRRYLSRDVQFDGLALEVDERGRKRSSPDSIRQGLHAYLKGKNDKRLESRVQRTEAFCDVLEAKITRLSKHSLNKAMHPPLQYIGYAFRVSTRWKQHDDDSSSSHLMSLLSVVSRCELGDRYTPRNWVICYVERPNWAPYAEVLLTRIANGFSDTGGGLGVHPAGQNVHSAHMTTLTEAEKVRVNQECAAFITDYTPIKENLRWESRRLDTSEGQSESQSVSDDHTGQRKARLEREERKIEDYLDEHVRPVENELIERRRFLRESKEFLGELYDDAQAELERDVVVFRQCFRHWADHLKL